jgi:glycosyltransferase involved in cell wall biosynthesis
MSPCAVFVWENFGPIHLDRISAVARHVVGVPVVGVEFFEKSSTYAWNSKSSSGFTRIQVFAGRTIDDVGRLSRVWRLLRTLVATQGTHFFLCHYERPETFLSALMLRLLGRRVVLMNDSKFDDYPRHLWRELLKYLLYMPYQAAIASGLRSSDYVRFLGIPHRRVHARYNTMDVARIRRLGAETSKQIAFADRPFLIVARLVPKKNLLVTLEAYSQYASSVLRPRRLHIAGGGPLEQDLREAASRLGVTHHVNWHGFVQEDVVYQLMSTSLALLLLSTEEQFGNVVIEAQALRLPVIVSTNVGARDELVRTGVNGFVVEPDNAAGAAFFMHLLSEDEALWQRVSAAADSMVEAGDVARFVEAVKLCLTN